jgi:hypothetical protein
MHDFGLVYKMRHQYDKKNKQDKNATRTRQERAQTRQQPAKRDSNATGFYRPSFRKNPGFPYMLTR